MAFLNRLANPALAETMAQQEAIMIRVVTVWGKTIEITVNQKSKSVWIASGEYLGDRVQVQGRSPDSAAALWQKTATYRGN